MSWDATKNALKVTGMVFDGLGTIQKLTQVGGDKAAEALVAIDAVIKILGSAASGTTPHDDAVAAIAEIQSTHDRLVKNDAAAQAAIGAKFPED